MNLNEYLEGLNDVETEIVEYIWEVCDEIKPQEVLEIGSGWGVTARAFLEKNVILDTIDKRPLLDEFDQRTAGFSDRIRRHVGDSTKIVPTLQRPYDLIYVDGNHEYDGVIADLRNVFKYCVKKGTVILMDDFWHKYNFPENYQKYGVNLAVRDFIREADIKYIEAHYAGNGTIRINV